VLISICVFATVIRANNCYTNP